MKKPIRYIKRGTIFVITLYLLLIIGLYQFQEKLLYHPQKLDLDYQEKNLSQIYEDFRFDEYEDIFLEHNNGTKINAQLIPTKFERIGLVYFLHGNRGNISYQKIDIPEYLDRGYDVFMIDYQGYGKSEGEPSKIAIENDVLLGYDYIKNRFNRDEIIIVGHSMGSYAATYCATNRNPKKLILMTPIYKLKEVITCKLPFIILPFPFKNDLDNSRIIEKVKCNTEIFIAEHDHLIPFKSTVKFKKHESEKLIVNISKSGGHNNLIGSKIVQNKLNSMLGPKNKTR